MREVGHSIAESGGIDGQQIEAEALRVDEGRGVCHPLEPQAMELGQEFVKMLTEEGLEDRIVGVTGQWGQ